MYFELHNGVKIPKIAFGTYNCNVSLVDDLVRKAIDAGFRHFDTAALYKNEEQVGKAISERNERQKFFITSKLPMHGFREDEFQIFMKRTLEKLKTNYLDLYLIHAPFALKYKSEDEFYPVDNKGQIESDDEIDYLTAWASMERIYRQGKAKAIGVSNFNNKELIKFCQDNQIQVSAFAPLAAPRLCMSEYSLAKNEVIQRIAKKHQKSWAQICLRFLSQRDIIPVVACENEVEMNENIKSMSFDLDASDLKALKDLNKNKRIHIFDYAPGVLDHKDYPFK